MENEVEPVSNVELSILEIISQHRAIHRINVMGQMLEMSKITGQSFDKALFRKSILNLEKAGYIRRSKSDIETFIITPEGKELL
jgi:DNA-binding MarR family transcriptional regulator